MTLEPGDHLWYWSTTGRVSTDLSIPQADWFPGFQGPTDYQGHGTEIFNYVVYESEIVRGQPHMRNHPGTYAWLNNNPGNITGQPGGPDFGQYPGKFNWHHFLIFPTWDAGFAAIAQLLRGSGYAGLTVLAAFQKYAPASDGNDPARYAKDVAAAAGVDESAIVGDLDDDQMLIMQSKITEIEGAVAGESLAYDSPDLPAEIAALLP
ncbi:hypothetical protein GCM10010168_68650 [Actinoplanes ianthinogenes]|uniref:Uncharacterized protein n=1 Tax=Actinoplanes ianthinogenes TaxID=122358 RepID=A0ABM7M0G0_9ACTN|nr:hypothetical protein [Actinoplanes ianthinogenes]BCJ45065.1 hypothetical protein Aiant_57220 [Actinoplanes ianthinogenes]GGR40328.1 hypothetical protein GCM10010168_68650 [Actinoplanes ianthinogenes]